MLGKVVDINDHRTKPHLSGEAFCARCTHTWHAVAPVGVEEPFECPSCGCESGRYKFEAEPPDGKIWTCNCGSQLFYVQESNVFCPFCGTTQEF